MRKISKRLALLIHSDLINQTGGINGLRDEKLLESALEQPFQTFDGTELYPSIQAKAARLGFGLVKNHAMIDGNKRLSAHLMLVFLAINGIELEYTQDELSSIILDLASSKKTENQLLEWILEHEKE